jgi:drug/metabolite transporter (DMT)-like permease
MTPSSSTRQGITVMVIGLFLFAWLDVVNKLLGPLMPVTQILWVRFLAFVPIACLMAWRPGQGVAWRTPQPWLQAVRGLLLVAEMGLFVWAFRIMHLADVQAIAAVTPLMVIALSVPMLGETVGWRRWSAVAVGFVGVLLIVRPGFQIIGLGTLIVLVGAALFALYQILLRMVGRTDGAGTTAVWSAMMGAIATSCVAPFDWVWPTLEGWWLLAAAAILGALGHTIYSKAFVLAPAAVLQPFNYLMLVFAVILGWLIFDHLPDMWTFMGAGLIVASGLYAFHRERLRKGV